MPVMIQIHNIAVRRATMSVWTADYGEYKSNVIYYSMRVPSIELLERLLSGGTQSVVQTAETCHREVIVRWMNR